MTNQWLGVGTGTIVRVTTFDVTGYGVITTITTDPAQAYGNPESDQRGITYAVQMRDGRELIDVRPDEITVVDMTDPEQLDGWLRHG